MSSSINVTSLFKHTPKRLNPSRTKNTPPPKRVTKPNNNYHYYNNECMNKRNNEEFINNLSNLDFTDYSDYELICKRNGRRRHSAVTQSFPVLTNNQQIQTNVNDYFDNNNNNNKNNTGNSSAAIHDESQTYYDQYIKSSFANQREYRRERFQKKLINKLGIRPATILEKPILCLKHFMGSCTDHNCNKIHESRPSHKLQLCKLYYGRYGCSNKSKCLYMHENFPCKYYYLGIRQHRIENCKFLHGPPLSNELKHLLLITIENSTEKVFGKTLNIPKEKILEMIQTKHEELLKEYPPV